MRRRVRFVDRGFEGFELPTARGFRAVPEGDDFDLLQGGELPRRRLVQVVPGRERGPAAYGQPFARKELLDDTQGFNLGRSVEFAMASTVSAPVAQHVLSLSGPDERARALTVSLFAELTTTGAGDQISMVRADFIWGSGGVQYSASVDFLSGAVFQLCCSSLRISVVATGQGRIKASAHVGYEAVGEKSAQRTVELTNIALGATSALVTIPNFAKDLQLLRYPATANCSLIFGRSGPTNLAEFIIGNGPGDGSQIYRIPTGAYSAWVINGLGAALSRATFVFGLCL